MSNFLISIANYLHQFFFYFKLCYLKMAITNMLQLLEKLWFGLKKDLNFLQLNMSNCIRVKLLKATIYIKMGFIKKFWKMNKKLRCTKWRFFSSRFTMCEKNSLFCALHGVRTPSSFKKMFESLDLGSPWSPIFMYDVALTDRVFFHQ